jgi:SAM-dependent methyltransferase
VERAEYDKLDQTEDRMWWFAALHANLLALYRRTADHADLRGSGAILDAGCGTGGLLRKLAADFPQRRPYGLDADVFACARARAKSTRPVCAGSVDALPFAEAAFSGIFCVDVLCHRDVDEARALAQFHHCLAEGGILMLNLPAYRWMLSRHDAAVANARRYTRTRTAALLRKAGFRPVFIGYWNMILFPLMVVTRKLLPAQGASDVRMYPRLVETLCRAATAFERILLRRGIGLPFGGSVLAVAAKGRAGDG